MGWMISSKAYSTCYPIYAGSFFPGINMVSMHLTSHPDLSETLTASLLTLHHSWGGV
jgi:hypothetical protein